MLQPSSAVKSGLLHAALGLLWQSMQGKFSSSCFVGELPTPLLGQHLQQKDAGVSSGKCSLHRYLLTLTSLPQVLQRGTSVQLGFISWKCGLEHRQDLCPLFLDSHQDQVLPELWLHSPVGADVSDWRSTTQGTQTVRYKSQVPLKPLICCLVSTKRYNTGVLSLVQVPLQAF